MSRNSKLTIGIAAYKSGIPGNGTPFPDGSKIAKIEWKPKKSTEAPFSVRIPDVLQDVFLIEKDGKKYPNTKGWAYAEPFVRSEEHTSELQSQFHLVCRLLLEKKKKKKKYK